MDSFLSFDGRRRHIAEWAGTMFEIEPVLPGWETLHPPIPPTEELDGWFSKHLYISIYHCYMIIINDCMELLSPGVQPGNFQREGGAGCVGLGGTRLHRWSGSAPSWAKIRFQGFTWYASSAGWVSTSNLINSRKFLEHASSNQISSTHHLLLFLPKQSKNPTHKKGRETSLFVPKKQTIKQNPMTTGAS